MIVMITHQSNQPIHIPSRFFHIPTFSRWPRPRLLEARGRQCCKDVAATNDAIATHVQKTKGDPKSSLGAGSHLAMVRKTEGDDFVNLTGKRTKYFNVSIVGYCVYMVFACSCRDYRLYTIEKTTIYHHYTRLFMCHVRQTSSICSIFQVYVHVRDCQFYPPGFQKRQLQTVLFWIHCLRVV